MNWLRRKPRAVQEPEPADPVLDVPVYINGAQVSLRECRRYAQEMADEDWMTPSEKGLALTVIYLIDRLKEVESERHTEDGA